MLRLMVVRALLVAVAAVQNHGGQVRTRCFGASPCAVELILERAFFSSSSSSSSSSDVKCVSTFYLTCHN